MQEETAVNINRSCRAAARGAQPRSFHVITFGCQMNRHDSEVVEGLMQEAGYSMAEHPDSASVILFNTCCVRQHAEQRLYGRISQLKRLKQERPDLVLAIGGCVAQKEKGALAERFSHVDIVFGTNAVNDIVSLVERAERGERPVIAVPEDGPATHSRPAAFADRRRIHAWVAIMRGCDNYCSYCVVPYVRGPQRSKKPEEVSEEVRALAENGVVEVTLLGQNVNSYGLDLSAGAGFAGLLEKLNEVPGIQRIRFTTSHPKDISAELIRAVRELAKVCEHLHLPAQSGSSRILRLMNRRYTAEEYIEKVEAIRGLVPEVGLTTDIIVGFPGESEEDFEQARALLERVQFDGAYIFKYSPRPGTAAARFPGRIDTRTIGRRHGNLLDFQKKISRDRIRSLVGTVQSVLPEHGDPKRPGHLFGRTRGYRVASLRGTEGLIGEEVAARISRVDGWTLIAEKLES